MNRIIALIIFAAGTNLGATAQHQVNKKLQQDKAAIKSLCGCYDVTFEYTETFPTDTTYLPKGYHKIDGAVEYITLVSDTLNRMVLQHLLVTGKEVIKHWTEEWLYENQLLLTYDQHHQWNKIQLPAAQVKGQWTQKVFGVNDEPRYENTATWVHADGRHYWEASCDAPLPRREYTTRKDYNVLHRTNHIEIIANGYLHDQDNRKVVRANGHDKVLVGEKGLNAYIRTEESKCQQAKTWWEENKAFWALVRKGWNEIYGVNNTIRLQKKVNDKSLYTVLLDLEKMAMQKELSGEALEKEITMTLQQFATGKHI